MAVELRIFDKEFRAMVGRKLDAFLQAATLELHRIARKKASISNRGVRVAIKRPRKGGAKTQRTVYPHSSRPGESPRRRTGFGHKNIVQGYNAAQQDGRVGYTRNARYMTFHELGIRYKRVGFQQRPTIVPAIRENHRRMMIAGRNAARAVQ
jgi:hypothetical protein